MHTPFREAGPARRVAGGVLVSLAGALLIAMSATPVAAVDELPVDVPVEAQIEVADSAVTRETGAAPLVEPVAPPAATGGGPEVHTPLPTPIPAPRGIGAWLVGAILLAGGLGFAVRHITSVTTVRAARRSALRDPLTGLANRRLFDEILGRDLARARRRPTPVSLLVIDLDGFKRVNDTRGHRAGDAVLRSVGEVLADRVRASDLAVRFGGDEFAVVLVDCAVGDASTVAETLRAGIERVAGPMVTASIGVAAAPLHADDADGLLRAADAAMYDAKRAGRNRVELAHGRRVPHSRPA